MIYSVIFDAHSTHPSSLKKVRDVEKLAAHSAHLPNIEKIRDTENLTAHSTHPSNFKKIRDVQNLTAHSTHNQFTFLGIHHPYISLIFSLE